MKLLQTSRIGSAPGVVAMVLGGLSLMLVAAGGGVPGPAMAAAENPTFYGDVLPILEANCQECHRPQGANLGGMVAPFSLTTYEEARRYAPLMAVAVESRRMPPWHAAPEFHGKFRNERYLSDTEIATIVAWAAAGAPEGDRPANRPSQPARIANESENGPWTIGKPDLIVRFDEPHFVSDDVFDEYHNIMVTLTPEMLPEPRWIKAVEVIPGGTHVHHVIATPIGDTAPGVPPRVYEDGYGNVLNPGTTVRIQMHYHKERGPGTAVYDTTKIGIIFYEPGEVIRHVVQSESMGITDFLIPPGDANYTRARSHTFQQDSYILSVLPHMHLRGKAAKYDITFPDGRQETLLYVPRYDFAWQHNYTFNEPIFAPRGTRVDMQLWWDNSPENPHNPDPTVPVRFGNPTTDEMGFGFITWVVAEPQHLVVGEPLPPGLRAEWNVMATTPAGRQGGAPAPRD
jgi:mono/diheme cytochrome c family protein